MGVSEGIISPQPGRQGASARGRGAGGRREHRRRWTSSPEKSSPPRNPSGAPAQVMRPRPALKGLQPTPRAQGTGVFVTISGTNGKLLPEASRAASQGSVLPLMDRIRGNNYSPVRGRHQQGPSDPPWRSRAGGPGPHLARWCPTPHPGVLSPGPCWGHHPGFPAGDAVAISASGLTTTAGQPFVPGRGDPGPRQDHSAGTPGGVPGESSSRGWP